MEKLMFKQINKFIEKHNIMYDYQFGFRKDHSTTLAIMEICENIIDTLNKGSYIAGLYLDLSKAFDTVDHKNTPVQTWTIRNKRHPADIVQ